MSEDWNPYYGEAKSGPLHMKYTAQTDGQFVPCQPPHDCKHTNEMREAFSWQRALDEAKIIVRSSPLFKKFISGTPLENDIPVWMAEFSSKLWVWKELETAIADSWVMHGKIKSLEADLQAATKSAEAKYLPVIEKLVEALQYVEDRNWTSGTPQSGSWINEFCDVAHRALAPFKGGQQ